MKEKNDVEILIQGKKLVISCYEDREYVQEVAAYLNQKYDMFRKEKAYTQLTREDAVLFLELNISDDCLKARERAGRLQEEKAALQEELSRLRQELVALEDQKEELEQKLQMEKYARSEIEKRKLYLEDMLMEKGFFGKE